MILTLNVIASFTETSDLSKEALKSKSPTAPLKDSGTLLEGRGFTFTETEFDFATYSTVSDLPKNESLKKSSKI